MVLNSPLTPHLIQKIEITHKKNSFVRIDAGHIEKLIKKEENTASKLSEEKNLEEEIEKSKFTVQLEYFKSTADHLFMIIIEKLMLCVKEMSITGVGMFNVSQMPEMYHLIVISTKS